MTEILFSLSPEVATTASPVEDVESPALFPLSLFEHAIASISTAEKRLKNLFKPNSFREKLKANKIITRNIYKYFFNITDRFEEYFTE
jgi:hypothetical protein